MHKCFTCGTEYEGSFCPECGTEWQDFKKCPYCGATLAGNAKFCNNCGYSFVWSAQQQKDKKSEKKRKVRLKVILPVALLLAAVIVMLSLIPTFSAASVNGVYYYSVGGEPSEKDYITLSSGKWTDSDGLKGKYKVSGKNITLTYKDEAAKEFAELLGADIDSKIEMKGTVKNGVLSIKNGTREKVYVSQKHKHKLGDWEVTRAATCTKEGERQRGCICKKAETQTLSMLPHNYGWHTIKEATCTERGERRYMCPMCHDAKETEIIPATGHSVNVNNQCDDCGKTWEYTKGLGFVDKGDCYEVLGIGSSVSGEVIIPEYYKGKPVTSIGEEAFLYCDSLTSITIPDSVNTIGYDAFADCTALKSVHITNLAAWCKISFGNWDANPLIYAQHLYLNGSEVTELVIPNGVTTIGDYAFALCIALTSVTIPDSVTEIGEEAFAKCISLINVTIPNSVTSIGDGAFFGCGALTSVVMGNGVTTIGDEAFMYCSSLTSVHITDLAAWCKISFGNWAANPLRYAHHLYLDGSEVTELVIPNGITSIEEYAFYGCSSLTSITLPDSVTSIGQYAFYGCSSLTSITLPDSVTSIGERAFYNCSSLTSIQFEGTKEQWKAITKGNYWNYGTAIYTVQCTDGKI